MRSHRMRTEWWGNRRECGEGIDGKELQWFGKKGKEVGVGSALIKPAKLEFSNSE